MSEKIYAIFRLVSYEKFKKLIQKLAEESEIIKNLYNEIEQIEQVATHNEIIEYVIDEVIRDHEQMPFYIKLYVGQGGKDAENWTQMLYEIYINFFNRHQIKYELLDYNSTDVGISSTIINVKEGLLFPFFKPEEGIHRLERVSPFKNNKSIQTSEASVEIIKSYGFQEINIKQDEIKIIPIRSGGPGGQHANKNLTGVRLIHIPTNLTVTVTRYRSLQQNRKVAEKLLKDLITQKREAEFKKHVYQKSETTLVRTYDLTRDQIRTYGIPFKLNKVEDLFKGRIELILLYNMLYDYHLRKTGNKDLQPKR